ncbi:MAG: hypothetical protein LBE13_21935, partial [Bacteroidales bacterium]|nr:hypothetical protein [Bacteroidales bacterium]
MKYYQQLGVNDCAPACLAMIASYYKKYVSVAEIKKLTKTDAMGTNFTGLINAAQILGFNAKAYRGNINNKTLDENIIFPFIAQIKIEYLGNIYDHFVVIENINRHSVQIYDPNPAKGKHSITRFEYLSCWTGYVLFITPNETFKPGNEKGNILFKYFPLIIKHKKLLLFSAISSFILIIFGIMTSFYYKYIIDEVVITKAIFTLNTFSIGILLIIINKATMEAVRNILINHFAYKFDIQLCLNYISYLFKLPISFFDNHRTGEILSRVEDMLKIREVL